MIDTDTKRTSVRGGTKPRAVALGLLAMTLSIGVGLILVEVGLRAFWGGEQYFPYYPNSARLFYPSEEITPGVSGTSRFSTNSFGTRGREPNGDERIRILTIGGSTTADTVLDDTEAWPARLEAHLNAKLGGKELAWVANSGIDGLMSHHHLMHATYLLPRLPQMDYVIIYAGANDLGLWFHNRELRTDLLDDENWNDRIGEAFRWSKHTNPDWPFYKRTELWKTVSRLKDRYLTARAMGEDQPRAVVQDAELRWLEEQRQRRAEAGTTLLPRGKLDTLPTALDSYGRVLDRIADEIRVHGAEPIFMTQAVQSLFETDEERERLWMGELAGGQGYVSEEQYPLILKRYNDRMREVAAEKGVLLIDLASRMKPGSEQFYDGMHFNELGADTAASEAAKTFEEEGLLDRARGAAEH